MWLPGSSSVQDLSSSLGRKFHCVQRDLLLERFVALDPNLLLAEPLWEVKGNVLSSSKHLKMGEETGALGVRI